ncbi:unnamed protein product [Dibothriocephalus latus]|uniref:Uncharacterized protein n=1 Tax=Dibothriocephalus latus TaxID=60516 RepID=A0A3P7P1F1_DIBLA|nr:unnamed protein product [Dibothriocephalus latus]
MHWDGKNCNCLDADLPYAVLLAYYVGTYLRFGLTAGLCPIIMGISCYNIINWVRKTPPKELYDSWNILSLPGTTEEQMKALCHPQGWMTASLCCVPLSIDFLISGIFETGYKCLCAAGLCMIQLDNPLYKVSRFLGDMRSFCLPIIIIVYIPALRALPVFVHLKCKELGWRLWMKCRNSDHRDQMDSGIH